MRLLPANHRFLPMLLVGIAVGLGGLWWIFHTLSAARLSFNTDVRPILNDRCLQCHGGVTAQSGFSLLFEEDAFAPTESGQPAIIPGQATSSEFIRRISLPADHDDRMPPKGDPLTAEEIETLKTWVRQGATWETHWAYQAPMPRTPPATRSSWPHNGIDAFVLERLHDANLEPSPPADCPTLLRRVSLDLIGLPPTVDGVDTACSNFSQVTYAAFADTLLASPRYGEHWATMWLDLARYADTKGYEKDLHRTIWMYRDWVIEAFNRDVPFDQFTIEQLAGDLLPDATDRQHIATAFHRNTMTNDEGGTDDEEFRTAAIIDRVNTTWEVWQGTTMACVQCHSHPYDPFRQKDYFTSFAFLNNTADADQPSEAPHITAYAQPDIHTADSLIQSLRALQNQQRPQSRTQVEAAKALLYPEAFTPATDFPHSSGIQANENGSIQNITSGAWLRIASPPSSTVAALTFSYPPSQPTAVVTVHAGSEAGRRLVQDTLHASSGWTTERRQRLTLSYPTSEPIQVRFHTLDDDATFRLTSVYVHPANSSYTPEQHREYEELARRLASLERVTTPVLAHLPNDSMRVTRIFDRGNWLSPTDTVTADVPDVLPPLQGTASPTRLDFARWLVNGDNPLTSRVTVNRLWAQIFGTGIVETLEDFGTQGAPPSHPELLDWLALRFSQEHAWSMKALLREIVLSATYQQTSTVTPRSYRLDPNNRLLARAPRKRLSAEQVRDQALAVSGLLSDKMYGTSVMPPQPPGIWNNPYSGARWTTSTGDDRYRRAVYTYQKRTAPYPAMITFDGPSREFCVSRRIATNTPLQALVTLNDEVYVEAAHALAQRMQDAHPGDLDAQLQAGYRMALFAYPSSQILTELRAVYQDAYEAFADESPTGFVFAAEDTADQHLPALAVVANVILNLDAFITPN